MGYGTYWAILAVFWALSSYKPLEPREGEPSPILVAIGPY